MDKVFKEKLSEAQFENMMFSDNKLLSYTQKNLDGLLNDDPKVKKQLTEILLTNIDFVGSEILNRGFLKT